MQKLQELISGNEDWLMHRVLGYAREHGYTRWTSTLAEAWRASIAGVSAPILSLLEAGGPVRFISADEDHLADPLAAFGIAQTKKHRERGVQFSHFLGLMKYYRKAYSDLVLQAELSGAVKERYRELLDTYFDRIELGFCCEWASVSQEHLLRDLQDSTVRITNEKNKYLTIFESLPSPVLFVNYDNHTVENCNSAAEALFFSNARTVGNYYGGGASRALPASIRDELATFAARREDTVRLEKQVETAAGTGDFIVLMQKMLDVSGKFQGYVVVFNDITALKEMEAEIEVLNTDLAARAYELEHANRELEAFNYSVSHDLRSPLTGINGYCQILLSSGSVRMDAQTEEYVRDIYRTSVRMNQLITTLLDFSRLSRCEMMREQVDLGRVASNTLAKLRIHEPEREVDCAVAEPVVVEGDPRLLQVVMENLLGNAWKYTAGVQRPLIEFGVGESKGAKTCFVRDNGIGFDMKEAHNLFAPFHRLHGRDIDGFGIGLATVERIIRRHGGKIWAEGMPGAGAVFYFTV